MTRRLLALTLLFAPLTACGDKDDGETASLPDEEEDTDAPPCDLAADPDCDTYTEADGDCDPNNNTVYPGARELPYDGLDNDCAGDGDLVDVDGDGYDSDLVGGEDCNDSRPDIFPGAVETCYDNIDFDCDGFPADGEEEGDDCDGDGFDGAARGGDDCDDDDPTVYPGAEEVWYDGVDQNCSGTIENDYDQDGDGEEIESSGGTDCDDTDPTVGFDLPERIDGVDGDCDGAVDVLPILDASASFYGSIATGEGYFGVSVVALDDYDGDGNREVGFGAPLGDDDTDLCNKVATSEDYNLTPCGGYFMVMPTDGSDGIPSSSYHSRVVGASGRSATASGDYLGYGAANLGDLDGDGWAEIALGAPARGGGTVLVMDGSSFLAGGDVNPSTSMTDIEGSSGLGGLVVAVSDVTGDGMSEVLAASGGGVVSLYFLGGSALDLRVWSGADVAAGGTLLNSGAIASLDGSGAGGEVIGSADFDGDGTVDVAAGFDIGNLGAVVLWDGSDIAAGGTFTAADYPQVSGPSTSVTGVGLGTSLGWLDDVDGDGYPELAAAAPLAEGDEEGSGVIYIIDGDDLAAGGAAATVAMTTIAGSEYYGLAEVTVENEGDINADGVSDLVFADVAGTAYNSIAGQTWVMSGVTVAGGGALTTADTLAQLTTRSRDDVFGAAGVMWDVDGDGDDDLAVTAPLNNDVGMAALFWSGYAD